MSKNRPQPHDFALLIAAHGERRAGAGNAGVAEIAADLIRRNLAEEIGIGFIKGIPRIDETLRAFASATVLVYPLFLSDGYFNRVRLPQLIAKGAGWRRVRVLPPLGLDPALAALVAGRAVVALAAAGHAATGSTLVLFAHGSPSDPASRAATEAMAARLAGERRFANEREFANERQFADVRCAFLDEPPGLADTIAGVRGPLAVVGLFAGEGLHGGADLPRLLSGLARPDLVFAGNVGGFDGIADIVAGAVAREAAEPA